MARICHTDDGWGVLTSPGIIPGRCWAHFSAIWPDNHPVSPSASRELFVGETVDFEWERPSGGQDGYTFRATAVYPRRALNRFGCWRCQCSVGMAVP
jgi:hypothetical protein